MQFRPWKGLTKMTKINYTLHILFSHLRLHSALVIILLFLSGLWDVFEYFLQQLTQTLFSYSGTKAEEQWFHFLCERMLSKCSYNGQLDWVQTNEKYISMKTPLPFPWPVWCIYNHFLTALQQRMLPFLN